MRPNCKLEWRKWSGEETKEGQCQSSPKTSESVFYPNPVVEVGSKIVDFDHFAKCNNAFLFKEVLACPSTPDHKSPLDLWTVPGPRAYISFQNLTCFTAHPESYAGQVDGYVSDIKLNDLFVGLQVNTLNLELFIE